MPAIAGLESAFGRRLLPGTYNAYGWGGGWIRFSDWEDSIFTVTKKLRLLYYDRGLKEVDKIALVYAPPNPRWGQLVKSIMRQI